MLHFIKKITLLSLVAFVFTGSILATTAYAAPVDDACEGISQFDPATVCDGTDDAAAKEGVSNIIKRVINIMSIVVGAVSVLMIIIGGVRYVVSAGDSNGVQGAKNTILYALVGLVVVLFSQIIARFVLSAATAPPPTP